MFKSLAQPTFIGQTATHSSALRGFTAEFGMGWESLLKFLINFYWQFLGGYDPRHFVYFIAIITYFCGSVSWARRGANLSTFCDGECAVEFTGNPVAANQSIAVEPAASQIAIEQLGSNGGGFFNTNSAHPLALILN